MQCTEILIDRLIHKNHEQTSRALGVKTSAVISHMQVLQFIHSSRSCSFLKKKNLDEIALNYNFTYLLSDIQSPLGLTVGNSLEVEESLACLRGGGPPDLRELVRKRMIEMMMAVLKMMNWACYYLACESW